MVGPAPGMLLTPRMRMPQRSRSMRACVGSPGGKYPVSPGRKASRRPSSGSGTNFRTRTGSFPDSVNENVKLIRGGSYKGRKNKFTNEERRDVWPSAKENIAEQRFLQLPDAEEYTRLRTFTIQPDGAVVSRGDSFRRRANTKGSSASSEASATPHLQSDPHSSASHSPSRSGSLEDGSDGGFGEIPKYEVALLGAVGTGKTSLINQFMSSDSINPFSHDLDEPRFNSVSVSIEGVVSELRFSEAEPDVTEHSWVSAATSAYLVVFCADSRASFKYAQRVLRRLKEAQTKTTTILVSNKIDLARRRIVSQQEGEALGKAYKVDYVEISVALNLSTDDLLIATLAGVKASRGLLKRPQETKRSLTPSCLSSPGMTMSIDGPELDATPDFTRSILRFSQRRAGGRGGKAKGAPKAQGLLSPEDKDGGSSCTNLTSGLNHLVQRIWRRRFSKSCDSIKS